MTMPAPSPTHARTRAALNLPGCCPLCGAQAVRKITFGDGIGREVYRCPVDGEVGYVYGAQSHIEAPGLVNIPEAVPVGLATPPGGPVAVVA